MPRRFWDFFRKFWNGHRENFLIVEQRNGGYEATLASRNLKKKEIIIRRKFQFRELARLHQPLWKIDKIIFSLDSRNATAVESIVAIKRLRPDDLIDDGELDQLIYQGFWKFLNRYRGLAAKKMATNDQELLLAFIQVREVRLGNQRVFNPVGFKGRGLSLRVRGTFVSRGLLPTLERFRKRGRILVFERGSVLTSALPRGNNLLVCVGKEGTSTFKSSDEEQAFEAADNWGTDLFAENIALDLGVGGETAQSIVEWFLEDRLSNYAKRRLESGFSKNFQRLAGWLDTVKRRTGMSRPKLYFSFSRGSFASSAYLKKLKGAAVRIDEELARREVILKIKKGAESFKPPAEQETLALLTFEYDLPKMEFLNQLLKRRVRWLIPNF